MATVGRSVLLPRIIDAILADRGCAELIVVVDGFDPDTANALERVAADRPRLRVLTGPSRGQLGALDEAVRLAESQVIVLLDDDVLPDPGLISGHARRQLAEPGLVVVGPMPVRLDSTASVATRLYAVEYLGHVDQIARGEVDVLDALWTGNVSMRRSDCLRVGLQSTSFSVHYHADRDLGYRLSEAGLRGRFEPTLTATHLHTRGDASFLSDARTAGAGRVALHRLHPERLGTFERQEIVADLQPPLRVLIRAVAATPAAPAFASVLMAAGRVLKRLHRPAAELAAAKLARRVMQLRGANEAQAAARTRHS